MTKLPTLNLSPVAPPPLWQKQVAFLAEQSLWYKLLVCCALFSLILAVPLWQTWQSVQRHQQLQFAIQQEEKALNFQQRKLEILQKKNNAQQTASFSHQLSPIAQLIEDANSPQFHVQESQWQGDSTMWLKLNASGQFGAMSSFLQTLSQQFPQLHLIRLNIRRNATQPLQLQTLWQFTPNNQ